MADKQRFLMYFSYIGTGFWGSQYQFNKSTGFLSPTIQNSVEVALKKLYNLEGERPIIVRICSRTDSGVHALKAALQVDLPQRNNKFLHPFYIKNKLNSHFAKVCRIRILDVIRVHDSFSVSKAVVSKTYMYRVGILKEEFRFDGKNLSVRHNVPVSELCRTYFLLPKAFNLEKAKEATSLFVGEKDFQAVVRKYKKNIKPTVCNILSFTIENAQPQIPMDHGNEMFLYYQFVCKGTRFLFHMVRAMVGAVLSVGLGRTSLDEIRILFDKPEPSSWQSKIFVVPGYGLYLADTTLDLQKCTEEEKKQTEQSAVIETNTNSDSAAAA